MGYYTTGFYEGQRTGSLTSASAVVPSVVDLVQPESVVDIGCGVGTWLSEFARLGIDDHLGVDGSYVDRSMLLIAQDRFREWNLESAVELGRTFDLAITLEVAEHLEEKSADGFVESLTRIAPVVLFSAAIPHQTGEGHINEQWPDYWSRKFADNGYRVVDCLRGEFWNDDRVQLWYRQNMMLFVREEQLASYPKLAPWLGDRPAAPLSIVHPDYFEIRSSMALERPWFTLASYYREALVETLKNTLPDRYVVALKNVRHRLLDGR